MNKLILALIIASLVSSGCTTVIKTGGSVEQSDGTKKSTTYDKREKPEGFDALLGALGVGLMMALIFKAAPKEAYNR
jgi:uncharacterized protein YceK